MPARPTGGSGCSWWPTPRARDWKNGSVAQATRRRACPLSDAVLAGTGRPLQPAFAEWLMGFPPGWTDPDPTCIDPTCIDPTCIDPTGPHG